MMESGLPTNFCMPELVPDFRFNGRPQMQLLVAWLDALCETSRGSAAALELTGNPQVLCIDDLMREWTASTQHELLCAKVVTGWLLQRIRSETPEYPPVLLAADKALAAKLGGYIGGCSNLSFFYNWQHPSLQPGTCYRMEEFLGLFSGDGQTSLRCRFVPLGGQVCSSFEAFILGHVEMEAKACLMCRSALQVQHSILKGEDATEDMLRMAERGEDMFDSFQHWFNENRVRLDHWSDIQATLRLPEYTGMGGVQNTSVFLVGEILGVTDAAHPKNKEGAAEAHFVKHQRQVVQFFKERRNVLRDHVQGFGSSKLERACFERLVRASLRWRASHRARVLKYVRAAQTGQEYQTSTGQLTDTKMLAEQFDSRMEEFAMLLARSKL